MRCNLCEGKLQTEVRLYYLNKIIGKFDTNMDAENYALENSFNPCIIQHVYICQKCNYEKIVIERVYTERLPDKRFFK